jgi:lipopolysaccharide export system permease protein
MLFHSSLRKELSRSFGATLVVLVTVVMTMTLIRTLGQASRGSFDPADVTLVMGYTVLSYMPTLLTMSLFIAIMATMSRMYRDSEMVIWFTAGRGLAGFLRPLFTFSWPVFAVVAVLSLLVLPWSHVRVDELRQSFQARGDIERIEPGQFKESANGARVFFIDKSEPDASVGTNVFISSTEDRKQTVTSARSGRVERSEQGRFLVLENGQRLEVDSRDQSFKLSEFEQYSTRVSDATVGVAKSLALNTVGTAELLGMPEAAAQAELSWRLGMALAALNLVVIGAGLANGNPRAARSVHILFALFVFVVYYNLLNLGQSWIATGKVSAGNFQFGLHGGVGLLAWLWMARMHFNWTWRRRERSAKSQAGADGAEP